jgi:hypothetical protein
MALTRRQKQVYDFLAGFVEEHGYFGEEFREF